MTPRKRRIVLAVPAGGSVADLLAVLGGVSESFVEPVWEFEPPFGGRPAYLLVTSTGRRTDSDDEPLDGWTGGWGEIGPAPEAKDLPVEPVPVPSDAMANGQSGDAWAAAGLDG